MPGIAVLEKNGVMAGVYFQHIYGASIIPDSQPVDFLVCLHVRPAELEYGAIVVCSIRGSDLIGVQLVVRGFWPELQPPPYLYVGAGCERPG